MKIAAKPADSASTTNLVFVPLEHIVTSKVLPHREVDQDHATNLYNSIKQSGLDTPLMVWAGEKPGGSKVKIGDEVVDANFLIAGAHRREALRRLAKEDSARFKALFPQGIPVNRKECPLSDALLAQLRENVQRKDATAEQILPVLQHLQQLGMKQKLIAQKLGKSEAWVSMMLDIEQSLGEEGMEEVKKGGVSLRTAKKVAKEVKSGKIDAKTAISKVRESVAKKKASGHKRDEKKVGLKVIYQRFISLPTSLTLGKKLEILTQGVEYVIGETDKLPAELVPVKTDKPAAKKAAKK